jgi:hypothetical protein
MPASRRRRAAAQFSFITYLALFVHDTWGVPVALAAGPLALAHVGAAASRVPYGWVSDRWLKGARTPLLRGMGVLAMAALLALLLLPQGTSALVLSTVTLLFGISGLSWGACISPWRPNAPAGPPPGSAWGSRRPASRSGAPSHPSCSATWPTSQGRTRPRGGCWCWGYCSASACWAGCRPPPPRRRCRPNQASCPGPANDHSHAPG